LATSPEDRAGDVRQVDAIAAGAAVESAVGVVFQDLPGKPHGPEEGRGALGGKGGKAVRRGFVGGIPRRILGQHDGVGSGGEQSREVLAEVIDPRPDGRVRPGGEEAHGGSVVGGDAQVDGEEAVGPVDGGDGGGFVRGAVGGYGHFGGVVQDGLLAFREALSMECACVREVSSKGCIVIISQEHSNNSSNEQRVTSNE